MKKYVFLMFSILSFFIISCKDKQNPKPTVYFRMSFPEHEYQKYETDTCPFIFEYPVYTKIAPTNDPQNPSCWLNINYNKYQAHIHLTLRKVNNNLDSLLDDSHTLVYKHTVKADDIEAQDFVNDSLNVFSTVFYIAGNAASPLQFHITDSVSLFLRGSVYFKVTPNSDSLAPAIEFVEKDAKHFIETFKWKKINCNACF